MVDQSLDHLEVKSSLFANKVVSNSVVSTTLVSNSIRNTQGDSLKHLRSSIRNLQQDVEKVAHGDGSNSTTHMVRRLDDLEARVATLEQTNALIATKLAGFENTLSHFSVYDDQGLSVSNAITVVAD